MRTSAASKRILAIDPGIANCGWAGVEGEEKLCGTITTKKSYGGLKDRFDYILSHFTNTHYHYHTLVIEDTYGPLVKSTGLLVGAFIGYLDPKKLVLVPPSQWIKKLFPAAGKGEFKDKTMVFAKEKGWAPDSQHAADAAALLEWYLQYGHELSNS